MKIVLLAITLFTLSVNAQEIKFEKDVIDYGTITQGSNGKRVFIFKNIGDSPLKIQRVGVTCGCTKGKVPIEPIEPGKKGEIEVSYDTKRLRDFTKYITVYSNAKSGRKSLKIKGTVVRLGK